MYASTFGKVDHVIEPLLKIEKEPFRESCLLIILIFLRKEPRYILMKVYSGFLPNFFAKFAENHVQIKGSRRLIAMFAFFFIHTLPYTRCTWADIEAVKESILIVTTALSEVFINEFHQAGPKSRTYFEVWHRFLHFSRHSPITCYKMLNGSHKPYCACSWWPT
jgi:hypothetical protein